MSRLVPRDKPLSEKDKKYLEARGLRTDVYPARGKVKEAKPEDSEESEEEELEEGSEVEDSEDSEEDYDEWSMDDLKEELKERKLSTSGNKSSLVSRLRQSDESE